MMMTTMVLGKIQSEQEEAAGYTYAAAMYRSSSPLPIIIMRMVMVGLIMIRLMMMEIMMMMRIIVNKLMMIR